MAQKDIRAKRFESNPDVFASIFNGLLFHENLIDSDGLVPTATESSYEDANDAIRLQNRDTSMNYSENGIENRFALAIFGVENQTSIDDTEPVRVMGYDYGNYRTQVDLYKSKKRTLRELLETADDESKAFIQSELDRLKRISLLPTITIVLNFTNKKWDQPKRLIDMVDTDNKFRRWMSDYPVYVYDMCNLTDEEIAFLSGDFAEVAKIFTYGFDHCDFEKKLIHPLDTLDFLIAYRNEISYVEARKRIAELEKEGDSIYMGTLVDEIERNTIIEAAKSNIKLGATDDFVIKFLMMNLELSEEEAKEVFKEEVK